MKRRILSAFISLMVVMSYMIPSVKAAWFYDVEQGHWAYNYITNMVSRGILSGYPDGMFRPDKNVTRAEFATIMTSAAGLNVTQPYYSSFDDVSTSDWYCPYIETARYYLSGYDTYYGYYYMPNDMALREDIAVAMVKLKGYDTSVYNLSTLQAMFTDWQSISSDAQKYVAIAVERGLISGYEDNTFRGQDSITRAEAATLLWKAYQYGNDNKNFSSETQTSTPKPTTAPAPKPTTAPEKTTTPTATPTPTETPNTNRLPYIIDSLSSAKVDDTYLMATQDNNDNLYYYDSDDNVVYKMNMNTGKKTQLLDVSSLTYEVYKDEEQEVTETVTKEIPRTVIEEVPIDEEEETISDDETAYDENTDEETDEEAPVSEKKTKKVEKTVYDKVTEEVTSIKTVPVLQGHYKDYEVGQLYYNTGNNKLLLIGEFKAYKSEKSYNDKDEKKAVIYEISGNGSNVYSETNIYAKQIYGLDIWYNDYYTLSGIIGNKDNGDVFIRSGSGICIYNLENNININDINTDYYGGFFYTKGNKAYYCDKGRVYEYSFSSNSKKALWDDAVADGAYGLNNKNYYVWDINGGEINKISSDGKPQKLKINTKTDIEVNDFYNIPIKFSMRNNYKSARIFITNDESFIFYDAAAAGGTWRKIEKQ